MSGNGISRLCSGLAVLGLLATGCSGGSSAPVASVSLDHAPPWPLNLAAGGPNIVAAGLKALPNETLAVHFHAHLDVVVEGTKIPVPAYLGMVLTKQGAKLAVTAIAPLHTHDATGLIHIEAPSPTPFRLGQVFAEWGLRLDERCLGGLCTAAGKGVRVSVNGRVVPGDPAEILLAKHQQITVQYGELTGLTPAPASYAFPPGQ